MHRRTDFVRRFSRETAALTLIIATLEQDRMKWRGVQIEEELRCRIVQAAKEVIYKKQDVSVLDKYFDAA